MLHTVCAAAAASSYWGLYEDEDEDEDEDDGVVVLVCSYISFKCCAAARSPSSITPAPLLYVAIVVSSRSLLAVDHNKYIWPNQGSVSPWLLAQQQQQQLQEASKASAAPAGLTCISTALLCHPPL